MSKADPAWLKAMKKEADKLGLPLRELLTKSTKPKSKPKAKSKTMAAAKGGMLMVKKDGKKIPAFAADGVGKMNKGGMAKKSGYMYGGMAKKPAAKKK